MSNLRRPATALVAASLVLATLLAVAPAPASALEPPRPLPGYRPDFVTETDQHPWIDCLWASGAMLLDKWTNGRVHVTHQRLRALSGDRTRGSTLDDLKVAYRRLGFHLEFSPDGGNRMTFNGLLRRLGHGAGAVLLGDYSQLPRWYGRWDYGFWHFTKKERKAARQHKKHATNDNHAVYVERYDPRHGRVWLMDPLGRGEWRGEWISVAALREFVWSRGGAIYAAVTPTAKTAPFAGVRVGGLNLTRSATTLDATWSLRAPRRWRFPGVDIRTAFSAPADPLRAAALSPDTIRVPAPDKAPVRASVAVAGRTLHASEALPEDPGAYVASLRMTDRRFGYTVAQFADVAIFVPGSRRATLRLHTNADGHGLEAGRAVAVSVSVANTGSDTWAETSPDAGDGLPDDTVKPRHTRLVARWIPLDVDGHPEVPDAVVLDTVPLAPGKRVVVDAHLKVPEALGTWALAVDIVDDVNGSFAALGSAPDLARFDVVVPRGFVPAN